MRGLSRGRARREAGGATHLSGRTKEASMSRIVFTESGRRVRVKQGRALAP